jgi:hypothetical protein
MEHRCDSREESDSTVIIYLQTKGTITANIKNISQGGMLVNTGKSALNNNTMVELVFATHHSTAKVPIRIKALTVHVNGDQAGLMFIGAAQEINADQIINLHTHKERAAPENIKKAIAFAPLLPVIALEVASFES